MTSQESLDTKVFINTERIGAKNVALTFSSKLNSFSNPFGKNIFVMKSSQFTALG